MVRGVMEIKGLTETKTLQGSKKRSMPRAQNAIYLEMFILEKEKGRLEKEMIIIDKRKASMQRRLNEIVGDMKKLGKAEILGKRATPGAPKSHHKKGWKTMAMTY